jgi:hypothetical protein
MRIWIFIAHYALYLLYLHRYLLKENLVNGVLSHVLVRYNIVRFRNFLSKKQCSDRILDREPDFGPTAFATSFGLSLRQQHSQQQQHPVLGIRNPIRRIRMFWGLPDPDPLV